MKIKQPPTGQNPRLRRRLVVGWMAYTILVFCVGAVSHRTGFFSRVLKPVVNSGFTYPVRVVQGWMAHPPRMDIDVKLEDFRRLQFHRQQAMESHYLLGGNEQFVNAQLTADGEVVPIKLRLKGDSLEHLVGDKWSFRVRTRGDQTVAGMKQFSLHHPGARNYLAEWFFHRVLRKEGLLGLRYDFVEIRLNGKNLGIYAREEHFDSRLLEHNQRRAGPIVRFSEDLLFKELSVRGQFPFGRNSGAGTYLGAEVDGFQTAQMLSDPVMSEQYETAVRTLEDFRSGTLEPSQAFDVPRTARYFALVDLLGAEHGSRWHNIRFYFNPFDLRLEPIGFDGNCGQPLRGLRSVENTVGSGGGIYYFIHRFYEDLFRDHSFYAQYLRELARVSQPEYVDQILTEFGDELEEGGRVLYREFPHYEFDSQVFVQNAAYIRSLLNPSHAVHATWKQEGEDWLLRVANNQSLPVELLALDDGQRLRKFEDPIVLSGRGYTQLLQYRELSLGPSTETPLEPSTGGGTRLLSRVLGTPFELHSPVQPWSQWQTPTFPVRQSAKLEDFEFLTVDDQAQVIRFRSGEWQLRSDLILPADHRVLVEPNTSIDLLESAVLVSRSPIEWYGTAEQPGRVHSSDGTGQGLVVLSASAPSVLSHVVFTGLTSPRRPGWTLTGAVTFYESPVSFTGCTFEENQSEDGLNVMRTEFSLQDCEFRATTSDAFDADFCSGRIGGTRFRDCGNDAIDFSGSVASLEQVMVGQCGDKAVSAGESSRVTASDVRIQGAKYGFTAKDRSELVVQGGSVEDCEYSLVVFQKKPEFGPAQLSAQRVALEEDAAWMAEVGSELWIDGVRQEANIEEARNVVYPEEDAGS